MMRSTYSSSSSDSDDEPMDTRKPVYSSDSSDDDDDDDQYIENRRPAYRWPSSRSVQSMQNLAKVCLTLVRQMNNPYHAK